MKYKYMLVALLTQLIATTGVAETGYKYLGYGRLVTNDLLGDEKIGGAQALCLRFGCMFKMVLI